MIANNSKTFFFLKKMMIIIFPIISYFFYNYVGFSTQLTKAVYFGALILIIIYVWSVVLKVNNKTVYKNVVRNILFLMIVSIVISLFFWGQSISLGFRATAVYLAIIYFFLLIKIKPSLGLIEKTLWILCAIYVLLWLYGLYKAPQIVFGVDTDRIIDDNRGIYRLSIPGRGIIVLCYFLAINKFVCEKKIKWVFIFSFLFAIIVMHVIRQVIAISFLVGFYFLLKKNKYLIFWMLLMCFFVFSLNNIKVNDDGVIGKIISLSESQVTDQNSGNDNTRVKEYSFFFTNYSDNIITNFFGNGVPHIESEFGKRELRISSNKDFFASDVGYAEIFIRFGILGLFFYGLIFYKVIKQSVPNKYMYAKLFMIYMLFANIAGSWIFQDVIMISFCLYVLEIVSNNCDKTVFERKKQIKLYY